MLSEGNERDTLVPLKYNVYLCIMKTILFLNLMFAYIVIGASIFMGVCLMSLKYFPTSKVSSFVRRHIITDEDLEPMG